MLMQSLEHCDLGICDEKYSFVACLLNPAGALINWQ